MSRTYRTPSNSECYGRKYFRYPRYKNQRTNTYYWIQEAEEYDYRARTRDKKLCARFYINPWNDTYISARYETDFHIEGLEELATEQIDEYLEKFGPVDNFTRKRRIINREWDLHDEIVEANIQKIKERNLWKTS